MSEPRCPVCGMHANHDHAVRQPASEHRGSCRIFYAEAVCTCGAEPASEPASEPPYIALRRLLDAYYGDKPESVEVAIAAQKLEQWLAALAAARGDTPS